MFPSTSPPYPHSHLPCLWGLDSAPSEKVEPRLPLTASAPPALVALDQADPFALVGADRRMSRQDLVMSARQGLSLPPTQRRPISSAGPNLPRDPAPCGPGPRLCRSYCHMQQAHLPEVGSVVLVGAGPCRSPCPGVGYSAPWWAGVHRTVTSLLRAETRLQISWTSTAQRWPGPIPSKPMQSIAAAESEKMACLQLLSPRSSVVPKAL